MPAARAVARRRRAPANGADEVLEYAHVGGRVGDNRGGGTEGHRRGMRRSFIVARILQINRGEVVAVQPQSPFEPVSSICREYPGYADVAASSVPTAPLANSSTATAVSSTSIA